MRSGVRASPSGRKVPVASSKILPEPPRARRKCFWRETRKRGSGVERVKAIRKNAAVADAESYRPELVENDEPRYLRRQKPVEIRRKKFGGKNLSRYRTMFGRLVIAAGCGVVAYVAGDFLLHSPKVLLLKPEQVEVTGNHIVSR